MVSIVSGDKSRAAAAKRSLRLATHLPLTLSLPLMKAFCPLS